MELVLSCDLYGSLLFCNATSRPLRQVSVLFVASMSLTTWASLSADDDVITILGILGEALANGKALSPASSSVLMVVQIIPSN